jgi:putative aldouronate transport system permease protein
MNLQQAINANGRVGDMDTKTKSKRLRTRWRKQDVELTFLALPTTVWYILFCFLPMFGIIIAFKDFKISGGFLSNVLNSPWSGFKNFEFLFKSNDAWIIIRNTLGYNIIFIILSIVIPVTLALMIGMLHNRKAGKVYQTMMFLPYFLSWVVVSAVGWAFLSFDKGIVNQMLINMGSEPINWYMEPKYWPYFLIFMNVWKGLGYGMVVYLATITGIDKTYYEAAVIDGASIWQQTRFITLPLMKLVIVMMFILAVGRIFYTDFGLFFQVPRDSNSLFNVTTTIDVLVYKQLKTATVGMASAAAFVQSVLGCLMILTANWVVRRIDPDSAMI